MDPNMHFQDSFYLATHIIYATSAYSGVKTFESDMPWLYKYIRRSFSFWMTQARLKLKDPGVYVDVDGVGEALDNLRGTGLTEVTDSMVCEGTVWLLDIQLKNGSWPVWFDGGDDDDSHDSYDLMHSTWVCTQVMSYPNPHFYTSDPGCRPLDLQTSDSTSPQTHDRQAQMPDCTPWLHVPEI